MWHPVERQGHVCGILGNFDGDPSKDLALRSSDDYWPDVPLFSAMYHRAEEDGPSFADSWRVPAEESLFESSIPEHWPDCTDTSFPPQPIYVNNLDEDARNEARESCLNAGISEENTTLLDACILDVVAGGTEFLDSHTQLQDTENTQGAENASIGSMGVYFSAFESEVGTEWSRLDRDFTPSNVPFLGPFVDDFVDLTLYDLPEHSQIALSFDLFVVGEWDGDGGSGPSLWGLYDEAGGFFWETTFSNTDSSQSFPGSYPSAYAATDGNYEINSLGYDVNHAIYRLTFPEIYSAESTLTVSFYGDNLILLDDAWWGIGRIDMVAR